MRTSEWISTATNVVLAVCAVVVTGLVVMHDVVPRLAGRRQPPTEQVPDWRRYAAAGHRTGPATAPVEFVVFSDFQCPACRRLTTYLNALRAEYPDRISVVYRHAPLASHPFAVTAAKASECAARQGRFDQYHDALFENQETIGFSSWSRFAVTAGVPDTAAFDRCVADPGGVPALARDTVDARSLNVKGTPTFLVNGTLFRGTPPLETLRRFVVRSGRGGSTEGFGNPGRTAAR
jgi:protein-disulfide isomerase